jgi:hypothetical protein
MERRMKQIGIFISLLGITVGLYSFPLLSSVQEPNPFGHPQSSTNIRTFKEPGHFNHLNNFKDDRLTNPGTPVPIQDPVVTYASWGDQNDRNQGMVYIYPLEDGTDLNLYEETSTISPIQITTLVLSVTNASEGIPIQFGPLTEDQYFFKLESSKPVNWELTSPDYSSFRESSRFVASEKRNFRGRKFYFHADDDVPGFSIETPKTEEIVIINPGPLNCTSVEISKFNPNTNTYDLLATTSITAGDFDEYTVNEDGLNKPPGKSLGTGEGFYRVLSDCEVLVWEGRWLANNMTIGAADDGSTIGSTIFASAPNDESYNGSAIVEAVAMRIIGITSASYTVSASPGPGLPFSNIRTGTVGAEEFATETGLLEDHLYKITTNTPDEKVQIQYIPEDTLDSDVATHGAEMIGGHDGGRTTNPGTNFLLFFESDAQDHIDVLIPEPGTDVTITGISPPGLPSGSMTSSVNDQVFHFAPGNPDNNDPINRGFYRVTSTKSVWVVVNGVAGDQQGYFVYVSESEGFGLDIKPQSCPNPLNPKSKVY